MSTAYFCTWGWGVILEINYFTLFPPEFEVLDGATN